MSFVVRRSLFGTTKRKTCYPLTFEHCPPLYCGEAANFIPHSSRAFNRSQGPACPPGITLYFFSRRRHDKKTVSTRAFHGACLWRLLAVFRGGSCDRWARPPAISQGRDGHGWRRVRALAVHDRRDTPEKLWEIGACCDVVDPDGTARHAAVSGESAVSL